MPALHRPHHPLLFWVVAPLALLSPLLLLAVPQWTPLSILIAAALFSTGALCMLALYSVAFSWVWRILGGMIFLATLGYSVGALLRHWGASDSPDSSAVLQALASLVVFGVPGLYIAVRGVFNHPVSFQVFGRPRLIITSDEEPAELPCPSCGHLITWSLPKGARSQAFQCPQCGETGTWC